MYKLILYGLIIGIGKILPGVSGAMMAISLGVYEKSIIALNNIFNKKSIQYLTYLCIGISTSIILFTNVIMYFVNNYYFWTMLLFIGLIIGGLKELIVDIKTKINIKNILLMIIPILLMLFVNNLNIKIKNYNFLTFFMLGSIELLSMIIPGVSGTSIYLMLDAYDNVMTMFSRIYIHELFPFILGMLVSLFILARIIKYLIDNYKTELNFIVLGFSIVSIFILFKMITIQTNILNYILGIFLLIIGIILGSKLN